MVIADDIPRDAVFSDAPVAAYASLNDHVSKFSFALFDYLYPVFNLLKLLGVYDPNFQLILAEQHQVNQDVETCLTLIALPYLPEGLHVLLLSSQSGLDFTKAHC